MNASLAECCKWQHFNTTACADPDDDITYEWLNNSGFEEWAVREFILKSGYKFHDLNADGVWQEGTEEGLEGWTIFITNIG